MSQQFIIGIIIVTSSFGLYALIQVLRMARKLSAERKALNSLRENLQALHGNDEHFSGSFTDLLKNLPEKTELYSITESVISAKKNGVVIKDKLLDELVHTFRFSDIHFVRKITSFLILIGLIGTLAGLSIGLKGFDPIAINEPGKIKDFLDHISYALISSMVAVGLTVVLIIVTHYFYEQSRHRFDNELSLFFRIELIPVLFPDEKKTDRMAEIQQIMTTFAKNANQLVSHSSQSMSEFKQNAADILDAILLNNAQINNLQASISNVYTPFTQIANIQQQMVAISSRIGESVNENRNLISDSKSLILQLSKDASEIINAVKITESKVDQQTDNISGLVTTMNNLTQEMKKIAGSYMDLLPQFQVSQKNSADYLAQTQSNFNRVLNEIDSRFASMLNSIENKTISDVTLPIKQNVDDLIQKLDATIERFNEIVSETRKILDDNDKQLSSIKSAISKNKKQNESHVRKKGEGYQRDEQHVQKEMAKERFPEQTDQVSGEENQSKEIITIDEVDDNHETQNPESENNPVFEDAETTNPEQSPEGLSNQGGITKEGWNQEEEHPGSESSGDSGETDLETSQDSIKSENKFFQFFRNPLSFFNRN